MDAFFKIKEIAELFRQNGIEDPAREAEMLVAGLLAVDRAVLYAGDAEITADRAGRIDELALRRTHGEPLQYLTGHVFFCGLKISVGRGVLIPRPETELLAEEAIKTVQRYAYSVRRLKKHSDFNAEPGTPNTEYHLKILDLCTGSGCIALSIAGRFPDADIYGADASEAAIGYASRNAVANNIHNVSFRLGDLFAPLGGMSFDFIISNPPYVRHDEIPGLQREIRDFEPLSALDGGVDGLDFYRRIFEEAPEYLGDSGIIILEAGFGQADAIRQMAQRAGFGQLRFIKDFAGIDRIFTATLLKERGWD